LQGQLYEPDSDLPGKLALTATKLYLFPIIF